jgi:hypothetical protein
MSSPGTRPRNNKPAAAAAGGKGSPQKLRVLSRDGATRPAASIAMPRAKTELSEMLAGDALLCARRPQAAAIAPAEPPVAEAPSRDESPRVPAPGGDLAQVMEAWPMLPRNVRAAILAMIRETAS